MKDKILNEYIDNELKNIGEEPLPDGFTEKLHLKLVEVANEKKVFNFKPFINAAVTVAAVVAIAFGVNSINFNTDYTSETADLTPKITNEPMAVAETKEMERAMFDNAKTATMFGEYEVILNNEVLKVGDIVTVWVLAVDVEKKRISLSMIKPE